VKKIIVLIAIILLSGCATGRVVTGPEQQFQAAEVCVKEKKFKEAAATFRKIAADAPPASPLAADALFELALVHANHDNPQRDYVQAIQTFEQLIKRHPDYSKIPEAQIWISVLKTVQDLKKENEKLIESIEQLKRLDIRHEERRKGK